MDGLSANKNIPFTSRCPQIRGAQWVCHKVNTEFPHISSTKFAAPAAKFLQQYNELFSGFAKKNLTKNERKAINIFNWRKKCVDEVNKARSLWRINLGCEYDRVDSTFMQLDCEKRGNCGEDALMSAAILKMNGKKNVYIADLKSDNQKLDHCVCICDKNDDIVREGHINRNTIIIDSWLGVTDFAQNMFVKYKTMFRNMIGLKETSNLNIQNLRKVSLTNEDINYLREDYPQFIFNGQKFM